MSIRVRRVTDNLSYTDLCAVGYVPAIWPEVVLPQKSYYPVWVHRGKLHSEYGCFVETLIIKELALARDTTLTLPYNIPAESTVSHIASTLFGSAKIAAADIERDAAYWKRWTGDKLAALLPAGWASSDFQLQSRHLAGHPDLIILTEGAEGGSISIYDIKTVVSCAPGKSRDQMALQLLAYCALARAQGYNVKSVSAILPVQGQVLAIEPELLMGWDSTDFTALLLDRAKGYQNDDDAERAQRALLRAYGVPVALLGGHVPKKSTILETIKQAPPKYPIQFFLGSPRGSARSVDDLDLVRAGEYVQTQSMRCFIHTPYIINLCNTDGPDKWALKLLEKDLNAGQILGAQGVVVHTGAANHHPLKMALDIMFDGLVKALESATPECPVLLETPAGEGHDTLCTVDEMSEFYNRFTDEQKKLIKICVDTAHVWGADYEPMDYLRKWEGLQSPGSIGLIHYNDSKVKKGARLDRHEAPGHGQIGADKLEMVAAWAVRHGVALIRE